MSVQRISIRRLYSSLLVLALVLRALIPDGFMPDTQHTGMAQMMICPGMAGMHHDQTGKAQDHHLPCPFTPLATPDMPGIIAAIHAAPVYPPTLDFNLYALPAQESAKPWQSRGPPLFLTSA